MKKNTTAVSQRICQLITLLVFGFLLFGLFSRFYSVFTNPFPKEYRETSMISFAKTFAEGINPYSLASLKNDIPGQTSVYGFLAPLLLALPLKVLSLFGVTGHSLLICEIIAVVIEALAVLFIYFAIYKRTSNHLISSIASVLFYGCFWKYIAFGGAFPDQLGLLCSSLLIYFISVDEQKEKYHPILYSLILIVGFYIKQYFAITTFGLLLYLLFRSKKDFLKLVISGLFFGILSLFAVNAIFPLYLSEAFPIAQGSTGTGDIWRPIYQIIDLTTAYYTVLILSIFITLVVFAVLLIKNREADIGGVITVKKKCFRPSYELCQIITSIIPLMYIGQNNGTYLTYFLQIWCPYIVVCGCFGILYLKDRILICLTEKNKYLSFAVLAVFTGLILFSFYQVYPLVIQKQLSKQEFESWNAAYSLLDEYTAKGEVLVSPHLSYYMLDNSIPTYDYGQAEFNNQYSLDNFEKNGIYKKLFPKTKEIVQGYIDYNNIIKQKVISNDYKCIAFSRKEQFGVSEEEILNAGYIKEKTLKLITGAEQWETVFYTLADN